MKALFNIWMLGFHSWNFVTSFFHATLFVGGKVMVTLPLNTENFLFPGIIAFLLYNFTIGWVKEL